MAHLAEKKYTKFVVEAENVIVDSLIGGSRLKFGDQNWYFQIWSWHFVFWSLDEKLLILIWIRVQI